MRPQQSTLASVSLRVLVDSHMGPYAMPLRAWHYICTTASYDPIKKHNPLLTRKQPCDLGRRSRILPIYKHGPATTSSVRRCIIIIRSAQRWMIAATRYHKMRTQDAHLPQQPTQALGSLRKVLCEHTCAGALLRRNPHTRPQNR